MTHKKRSVTIICVALAVVIAVCVATPLIINADRNKKIEQYTQQNLDLYSELNVISDCAVVDKKPYSLAGIKEAVRLGADTVTLDLCFNSDGTPVVSDDYSTISEDSLLVRDVFDLITSEEYSDIRINFRLRQLITLSVFNQLVSEYDVSKRVIVSGINQNRYSLISGTDTAAKVYFDYIPSGDLKSDIQSVATLVSDYSLAGVVISSADISKELTDALSQNGISYIISSVDKEIDLYKVMSYGAYNIETDSPDTLKEAHSSWRELTLQRIDKSISDELNK